VQQWKGNRSMNNRMRASLTASFVHYHRAERHFRFLGLDAEDDELFPLQVTPEALLVEFVLLHSEAELLVSLIGDPLSWALLPQVRQIALKGAQGLLFQVRQLLRSHQWFLAYQQSHPCIIHHTAGGAVTLLPFPAGLLHYVTLYQPKS